MNRFPGSNIPFYRGISKSLFYYFASVFLLLFCTGVQTVIGQSPVSVTLSPLKDNTIYQRNTSNSNGAGEFFIAGTTGSPYFNHALIMFDIAGNIPAGAFIQSASLKLHLAGTSGNSGPYNIELHKLQKNWGEGSSNAGTQAGQGAAATTNDATWLHSLFSSSFWTNPGGDFTPATSAATLVTGIGFYTWDAAAMVTDIQDWLNNPSANNGWLLKSNELASFQAKKFESRENPLLANRPVLSITYTIDTTNKWTFIKGDTTEGVAVYGVQGVPDAANKPGGGVYPGKWKDKDGNFWIYGAGSEMWKFNPNTNQWTFIKADMPLNYGMKGIPAATNSPGTRKDFFTMTDSSGQLWLYAGYISQFDGPSYYYNDSWKYEISLNQWTWMDGDSTIFTPHPGIYGTQGVPVPENRPGARGRFASWVDKDKNAWIFGGEGYNSLGFSQLNDLWKYNMATQQWTWISGDSNFMDNFFRFHYGKYGIKGVAAAGNNPGSRINCVSWTDSSNNLWLFGGYGCANSNCGYLNDLWKFNINTSQWTWVNGDSTINNPGQYGVKGVKDPSNKPGARWLAADGWTDANGNLWLFGGLGYDGGATTALALLNDVWGYDKNTNEWVWVNGDQQANQPGIYSSSDARANKPGARFSWRGFDDDKGNFWLFGGTGYTTTDRIARLNDLWKYTPPFYSLAPAVAITSPANNSIFAAGSAITLNATATDTDGSIRKVAFYNAGVKFLEDSTAPYGLVSTDAAPGVYALTAIATDNNGATKVSDTVKITITGCTAIGSITGEGYLGIPGTQVADLIAIAAYPNNPTITALLNSFEYSNVGENYGARLRGYICAPQTGNYTFYVAGDEQAGLWLSTDESPANKTLIAYNETTVAFRSWTTFASQKSAPIHLVKGARYYIETLHKQGAGNNHLSVGWVLPDGTGQGPIPGSSLSPITAPPGARTIQDFVIALKTAATGVQSFKVTVSPNPSSGKFTLITSSNSEKNLAVVVTDVQGRVIEKRQQLQTNGKILLGTQWHAGIYFVEITQDGKKQRLKLVKQ